MNKSVSTEQRIKEAAKTIFTQKGLAGARMQDIADEAKINKAMLHYYFRNKKMLFEIIFDEKLKELFSSLGQVILSEQPFDHKIQSFVEREIDIISEFPVLPLFVLNELWQDPSLIEDKLDHNFLKRMRDRLKRDFVKEVKEGRLPDIPFEFFMINMVSLCIYPLIAKPILKYFFVQDESAYNKMIEQRKTLVANLLLNTI